MGYEIPKTGPSAEGLERLRHPKLLWISLEELTMPDIFMFFSLGEFTVTMLDPRTGEFVYEAEAAECTAATGLICLYPPNADEGDQIMFQMETKLENVNQRSGAIYVYYEGDWQEGKMGKAELVDIRPLKLQTPSPFNFGKL